MPGSVTAGLYAKGMFNFLRNRHTLFWRGSILHSLEIYEIQALHILTSIWYCPYFLFQLFYNVCVTLHDLNLHFINGWSWYLFMCLFALRVSSLVKCLPCFIHFLIGLFAFLLLRFESPLYFPDTSPLSNMWVANLFLSLELVFLSF